MKVTDFWYVIQCSWSKMQTPQSSKILINEHKQVILEMRFSLHWLIKNMIFGVLHNMVWSPTFQRDIYIYICMRLVVQVFHLVYSETLKTETVCSSETLCSLQNPRCYNIRRIYSLYTRLHGVTSKKKKKTSIMAVKTSNLTTLFFCYFQHIVMM
jgi:hypothetical protein